jgi:RNA polymerase sigma factor (sigma-70 family)
MNTTDWQDSITEAKKGNIQAFEKLVAYFKDMAIGYGFSLLHDFHLAEDAAQEAFIHAYQKLHQLENPKAFPSWFRSIVFKFCDRIKRKERVTTLPFSDEQSQSLYKDPSDEFHEKDIEEEVLKSIKSLTEKEQEAATLFYINGYTTGEVSGFLDISESAVKNRLHTARKKLKQRMLHMVENTLHSQVPGDEFGKRISATLEGVRKLSEAMKRGHGNHINAAIHSVLLYRKESVEYHDLMGTSGAPFEFSWIQEAWTGEYSERRPPIDEKLVGSIDRCLSLLGYSYSLIGNRDYVNPRELDMLKERKGKDEIRNMVVHSIGESKCPVIGFGTAEQSGLCVITGFESNADVILGSAEFDSDYTGDANTEVGKDGSFRKKDWLKDTAAILIVGDKKEDAVNKEVMHRKSLEYAVEALSIVHHSEMDNPFDLWMKCLEDETISTGTEDEVKTRLWCHRCRVGDVAEDKWFASQFLVTIAADKPFIAPELYGASSNYTLVHRLMWECWKLAGAYWRDIEDELAKFKDPSIRKEIINIIDQLKKLDMQVLEHLRSALDHFDLSHGSYMNS